MNLPTLELMKDHPNACLPYRAHDTDVGYDIFAIEIFKKISDKITLYDTGIIVKPPNGYYVEIVARSSLSKSGYMIANSVGIIDPDYRGSLKIALIKVDETMPDLELPFCKCQIILRKLESFDIKSVSTLDETERGTGGFGSTDKNSVQTN